jgi:hypothetical protein
MSIVGAGASGAVTIVIIIALLSSNKDSAK